LEALSVIYPGIELYAVKRGNGNLPSVGTWAHPKLAGFFARWLDVRFAVWCDSVIEDILKGAAQVTITKPEASAVVALPQDYEGALEALLLSVRDAKSLALPTSFAQALRLAAEQADVIEAQAVTSPTLRTVE